MKRMRARDLHRQDLKKPAYRKAYAGMATEFALVSALIEARSRACLTQQQLAKRMRTSQTVIARLESGRANPSTRTLARLATALGCQLKISFEPEHLPVR